MQETENTNPSPVVSKEAAQKAFRALVAMHSKFGTALRGFSQLKYALREDAGAKFNDAALESAFLEFSKRVDADDIMKDNEEAALKDRNAIKKAAWVPFAYLLDEIKAGATSYAMADARDKKIHVAALAGKLKDIRKQCDIPDDYQDAATVAEITNHNIVNFFIPLATMLDEDKSLLEALRRQANGMELRPQDQDAISRHPDIADSVEHFLYHLGLDMFAAPASIVDKRITEGCADFNAAFTEDVSPAAMKKSLASAGQYYKQALNALDATIKRYEDYGTTVKIAEGLPDKLEAYAREYKTACARWDSVYKEKQYPALMKTASKIKKLNSTGYKIAEELWTLCPAPIAAETDIQGLLENFQTSIAALKEKIARDGSSLGLSDKEFTNAYADLIELRERLMLVEFRGQCAIDRAEEIKTDPQTAKLYKDDYDFRIVVDELRNYANTVAYGHGDRAKLLTIPTTPTYIKAKGDALLAEIENPMQAEGKAIGNATGQIDAIDKSMLEFIRARPLLETLKTYALQQSDPAQMPWAGMKKTAISANLGAQSVMRQ